MPLNAEHLKLRRQKLFIPAGHFSLQQIAFTPSGTISAPTINIAGGEAGTVAIGIDSDADGAALSKTAATSRTGITGVQAPTFTGDAFVQGDIIGAAALGNSRLVEVSGKGITALSMNANGWEARHFMSIPRDWSRSHPLYARFIFSTQSTTPADTVLWKFFYKPIQVGVTVLDDPATAPDTEIESMNVSGTANLMQKTSPAIINANSLGADYDYWSFTCEMDTKAAGLAEAIHLYGIEFEYTPQWSNDPPRFEARA